MIAVIITRSVPDHLRGYLGRFLSEVVPGVFAGRTSSVVADRLWHRTTEDLSVGSMAMVMTDSTVEQGYLFRTAGENAPRVTELDGLHLIATRYSARVGDPDLPLFEGPHASHENA